MSLDAIGCIEDRESNALSRDLEKSSAVEMPLRSTCILSINNIAKLGISAMRNMKRAERYEIPIEAKIPRGLSGSTSLRIDRINKPTSMPSMMI